VKILFSLEIVQKKTKSKANSAAISGFLCKKYYKRIISLLEGATRSFLRNGQNLVFWGPRSFQFDLEMNINIYCMHYIIREDYWRPLRAASNFFFSKKSGQTYKQTNKQTHTQTG